MPKPLLSILIPTIDGREEQFNRLLDLLASQCDTDEVEILYIKDNKELSIGAKRQQLYEAANGLYSVQVDDDDSVADNYIEEVLKAIKEAPDCVCYLEYVSVDGIAYNSCHSNRFDDWGSNFDGYTYIRTPFYKDVIKTDICLAIGVNDLRYAEDIDMARRLKASGLIKKEVFIDAYMYFYHPVIPKNERERKERYGIK